MADIALDPEAIRRDRQRYQRLLDQVDQQIAAWSERAEHLRTTIGGLDHLLALAERDGAREAAATRRAGRAAAVASTGTGKSQEGSEVDAPRGVDALRLVLEADPQRLWSLSELLEALGVRGWLPTSRRPEEGVRISLKRLVERGGAERTEDGRWRLAGEHAGPEPVAEPDPEQAEEPWPEAEPPLAPDAPAAEASPAVEEPPPTPPPPPRPVARPASFGRPVGGTITEL